MSIHRCPECGGAVRVISSTRPTERGAVDGYCRRRYRCQKCPHKFTTIETVIDTNVRARRALSVIAIDRILNQEVKP